MRQSFRERREHLHRGIRMPGLLTMFLMLAILALLFVRLRDASTWRFFASADVDSQSVPQATAASNSAAPATAEEKPPKGGTPTYEKPPQGGTPTKQPQADMKGTDLDPEEMEDIKPSLSVLYDGSVETMPTEQPAYFRILGWVDHQSTENLRKRAMKDFFYDTLVNSPDTMRLQIVEVKLTIMQIVRVMGVKNGKPQPLLSPEGKQLYEVRGVSRESGSNLYFAMVSDVPADMPLGTLTDPLEARLVGYFFKVQGYYSKQQQLDAEASRRKMKPLKSPLIIGKLIWQKQAAATTAESAPVWLIAPIGGVAIMLIVGWVFWSSRRPARVGLPQAARLSRIDLDAPSVDNWLDAAQTGRMAMEPAPESTATSDRASLNLEFGGRLSGNILDGHGESTNGGHSGNGHDS